MLIVYCQNAYNYKLWNVECVNCEDRRRAVAGLLSLEAQENSTERSRGSEELSLFRFVYCIIVLCLCILCFGRVMDYS